MIWIEIMLLRPLFQLAEQYVPGATIVYSFMVFSSFAVSVVRGSLKFDRVSILFLSYIGISFLISALYGATLGSLVASFNKLLLFFVIMQLLRMDRVEFSNSSILKILSLTSYLQVLFVIVCLLNPASYTTAWGVKTFVMQFSSQHLTAAYIVSLMVSVIFEMTYLKSVKPMASFGICTVLIYALFMTGARTITVCGAVLYLLSTYLFVAQLGRRERYLVGLIIVLAICAFVATKSDQLVFFQKSSSIDGSFSNGRGEIWSYYMNVLEDSNLLELVFGHGCGFYSTKQAFFVGTHNDFITFAISYGLTGLLLYILYLWESFTQFSNRWIRVIMLTTVVFAAFSNGFCDYTDLVLSIALMGIVFKRNVCMPSTLLNNG